MERGKEGVGKDVKKTEETREEGGSKEGKTEGRRYY